MSNSAIHTASAIEPLAYSEKEASLMIGAPANSLRISRQTGLLWGVPAPKFIKAGNRIRYRKADLEAWLNQFQAVGNNAEAKMQEVQA